jgi:hypothetical protein
MSEETIYICINLHGGVFGSGPIKTSPELLRPPPELTIQKLTINIPGTTGLNNKLEYRAAKELIEKNPHVLPETMSRELIKVYKDSIPTRRRDDLYWHNKEKEQDQRTAIYRDSTLCSIEGQQFMEPNSKGQFFNKTYEIDTRFQDELFSIEILNGDFQGNNIINRDFIYMYFPGHHFSPDRWYTFPNGGPTVLKEINLNEIIMILVGIGIFNVFIIDPSCSNNFDSSLAIGQRSMKRSVLRRQFSGEETVMPSITMKFLKGGKRIKYKTQRYLKRKTQKRLKRKTRRHLKNKIKLYKFKNL